MKPKSKLPALSGAIAILSALTFTASAQNADTIYTGSNIITINDATPYAEALKIVTHDNALLLALTDAVKAHIIPPEVTPAQAAIAYASVKAETAKPVKEKNDRAFVWLLSELLAGES